MSETKDCFYINVPITLKADLVKHVVGKNARNFITISNMTAIAWFAFCRILMAISLAPLALLPFVLGKFRRRLTDRGDTRQISKSNGPTEPEGGVP